MNKKHPPIVIILVLIFSVFIVGAFFLSYYTSKQANEFLAILTDEGLGYVKHGSKWHHVGASPIVGYIKSNGFASYIVHAKRLAWEYTAILSINESGEIKSVHPLSNKNSIYSKRITKLLKDMSKSSTHDSHSIPIDLELKPFIMDLLLTVADYE